MHFMKIYGIKIKNLQIKKILIKISKKQNFIELKKNADEVYDILINNLYQSNFYNIIELIKPDNTISYSDNKIKLEILINDLKNKMFDKNI